MQEQLTQAVQPETSRRGALFASCGLAGALTLSLLPISRWLVPGDSMAEMLGREEIWWGIALAVLLWLTLAERLPLSSIGFRHPTWQSVAAAILGAFLVTAVIVLEFAIVMPLLHLSSQAAIAKQQAILRMPFWFRILLVLRAAIVEEILYRGYLIEKVRQLSGSTALAVMVSVATFAFAHLRGWGPVHLVGVAASGLVLSLLYVWRRDLPSNVLAHFLSDALAFLR